MVIHILIFSSSFSYKPSRTTNRSLYEELKAATSQPTFSSFDTSSEFLKFENIKTHSNSEESQSDETSIETKFRNDEFGFKNNVTLEERHTVDEAVYLAIFDEQTVKYISLNTKIVNKTTTEVPPTEATILKKGKNLELISRSEENMNSSLPNTAEVWALAGLREIETRRPTENNETSSDVELLEGSLNNTAKNLLDWTEITKMNNNTISDEGGKADIELSKPTVMNDISGDEDPATSENKGSGAVITSPQPVSTLKSALDENRLEFDNENVEFGSSNKSSVNSRIDPEVFSKVHEEREESAIELIDPLKRSDSNHRKQSLQLDDAKLRNGEMSLTTESNERTTTETMETTTIENYETTTSIVDSFTIIGEDEDSDDIFKRTITELMPVTTEQPARISTITQVAQTTFSNDKLQTEHRDTATEISSSSVNELSENTQKYNKSTSSLTSPTKSVRVVTTDAPEAQFFSTLPENDSYPTTLLPKLLRDRTQEAAPRNGEITNISNGPISESSDDKFRYNTLLPEITTEETVTAKVSDGASTKTADTLNKESLDGEQNNSNLGIISASVSIVVLLILAGAIFVSRIIFDTRT